MTEICDRCGNVYVQNRTPTKKWKPVFYYCSETCRVITYQDRKWVKEIETGNFGNRNISTLERLGFEVTVKKK